MVGVSCAHERCTRAFIDVTRRFGVGGICMICACAIVQVGVGCLAREALVRESCMWIFGTFWLGAYLWRFPCGVMEEAAC